MKNENLYELTNGSRAEQWIYATLGLAGALSILLALLSYTHFVQEKDQVMAQWSGNKSPTHMTAWRYVKTQQWRADMRTVGALAIYLMESEPDREVARVPAVVKPSSPALGVTAPKHHASVGPEV